MPTGKLPSAKSDHVVRALVACGLTIVRQRGSHVVLTKPGLQRPVIVAQHRRELPPGHIAKILRQAEVSPEEFLSKL
jgi:predicted RNA binding protein YcfA (HicA-like mRNA interferase family)